MPDFSKLLSKPVSDAKKPKLAPAGTYRGRVKSYKYEESKEKKTPFVRYEVVPIAAGEDIDPAEMEGVDLSKKTWNKDFYLTDDADYRLAEFLNSCNIETASRSFGETIPDAVNAEVFFEVTHDPNPKEEGEFFTRIGKVWGA